MRRLRARRQYVHAARGRKVSGRFFTLQANLVADDEPGIGFTVTKQQGNAPERNRIKRRLRAAAAACHPYFKSRHDYVLIGRRAVLSVPFSTLVRKLGEAAAHLDTSASKRQRT